MSCRRCSPRLQLELLEDRMLLAANVVIDELTFISKTFGVLPTNVPVVGQETFVRVKFTTTDLPSGTSYSLQATMDGQMMLSHVLTDGAGLSGSHTFTRSIGGWFAIVIAVGITLKMGRLALRSVGGGTNES